MTLELLDHVSDVAGEALVTLSVADQLCGIPVLGVRDVLRHQAITRIPLASRDTAGSLNLRGRIVTAIDLRHRLHLPPSPEGGPTRMSVVVEQGGDLYALLVDEVAEVIAPPPGTFERNPATLPPAWATVSAGVYRLDGRLLLRLDVARLLTLGEGRPG